MRLIKRVVNISGPKDEPVIIDFAKNSNIKITGESYREMRKRKAFARIKEKRQNVEVEFTKDGEEFKLIIFFDKRMSPKLFKKHKRKWAAITDKPVVKMLRDIFHEIS